MAESMFDELNLNPLVVVEDNEGDKRLPNEKDILDDKDDKSKTSKNTPFVETLEVDEEVEETPIETPEKVEKKEVVVDTANTDQSVKQWVDYYTELGLLDSSDEDKLKEVKSHEDIGNLILEKDVERIQEGIEGYKQSVPEIVKQILNHWEDGASEDVLRRVVEIKSESLSLDKIKDTDFKENKDLQKQVLTSYLQKTTRMTDKAILKHVNRLEELDELEEESTEALTQSKVLLKQEEEYIKEETKVQNRLREDQITENQNKLKEGIKNTKEIITGITVSEKEKKDIENLIFNPIGTNKDGSPKFYVQDLYNQDPIGMTVKMNYLASITKGFTDWSKINTKAVTAATKKVDSVFQNPPPRGKATSAPVETGDWKANLRQLGKTTKGK